MRVTDFGGFQLREQDGWDAGLNARQAEATTARTNVGPLEADEVQGVDTVGSGIGTTATLAIGASTNGWVNLANDTDWYAVTMVAGQSYTFTLNGTTLADPYLELYNSNGLLIGFDDDFGSGINSALRWTATATDTYYLNAQSFPGGGGTGSYTLSAATSSPANPLDAIDYHYTMPTTNISIWFSTPGYTNPSGDATLRSWTQPEIDAVMAALGTYTAIAPLSFSIAPSQGAATWIFSLVNLPGNTLGYFAVGSQYAAFDPTVADFTAGLTPGGNSWVTIIHEAGHGLGMAHPHDNGAEDYGPDNSEVMQGVTDAFESFGTFNLNQGVFTTMTYNDGWRTSGFGGPPSNIVGGQATPMALDVALIQQRYGVNPTTGSGNSTYTLALTNSAYRSIWDVSGTDTISYAGAGNATIDLRAATLLNAVGGGGYVSFVQGVHGGWTIANGVLIENATGGSGNDTLIGNDAANVLTGGAGVDTMRGGLGNDTYYVDNLSDIITEDADAGIDTVISSTTHALFANVENLTLLGPGIEVNGSGNALNNTIIGDSAVNNLQGLGGNDTLIGNEGNDALTGGTGDDILNGGIGSDSMSGGTENDTYYVDNANDEITENLNQGTDTARSSLASYTLHANVENLILETSAVSGTGNGLDNIITGNDANNTLSGLDGADTLDGGLGSDTMIGGVGDDTYLVDNGGDVVTENASEGTDTIRSSVGVAALAANVENLVLLATAVTGNGNGLNNIITGNSSNNFINGLAGADTMIGGLGNDTYFIDNVGDVVTELSGEGTDTIFSTITIAALAQQVENLTLSGTALNANGNFLNNIITGNAQKNTLNGGAGEDTLIGGLDSDTYIYNSLGDVITENLNEGINDAVIAFIDVSALMANVENVTLAGTAISATGNDLSNIITGNSLNNFLYGGIGNDQLNGAVGADTMTGGQGDDAYLVENLGDVVIEASGEGNDVIYTWVNIAALTDNVERATIIGPGNLNITGNALNNRLNGNDNNNVLAGVDGEDIIGGLAGNDTIIGGAGRDLLTGGAGADTFVYQALSDSGATGATRDIIYDFAQGQDLIDLVAIDAISGGGDDAFNFIGNAAFSNTAGELRYEVSGGYTIISMDINGDGIADSQITLVGNVPLTSADFGL